MGLSNTLHKGWVRIWFVSSIIITIAVFAIVYPSDKNQKIWFGSGANMEHIQTYHDEKSVIDAFFSRDYIPQGAHNCRNEAYLMPLNPESEKSLMVVVCPRNNFEKILNPAVMALGISLILLLTGIIISWIRTGFKQQAI